MYTEVLKLLRMLKVPVHLSAREGQTAGGMETQIIDNSSRIIKMMNVDTPGGGIWKKCEVAECQHKFSVWYYGRPKREHLLQFLSSDKFCREQADDVRKITGQPKALTTAWPSSNQSPLWTNCVPSV